MLDGDGSGLAGGLDGGAAAAAAAITAAAAAPPPRAGYSGMFGASAAKGGPAAGIAALRCRQAGRAGLILCPAVCSPIAAHCCAVCAQGRSCSRHQSSRLWGRLSNRLGNSWQGALGHLAEAKKGVEKITGE